MVTATERRVICSRDELRAIINAPDADGLAVRKQRDRIDAQARQFIAKSPFALLATASATDRCDVTPRGDGPGFVMVLDERTLIVPDRPGNRRLDSLENIIENPHAGLLFLIPGVDETLRVNGTAQIIDDPELLAKMAMQGKAPRLGIELQVEELFFHCAKALKRSRLWVVDTWPVRSSVPTLGRMLAEQLAEAKLDCDELDARLERSNTNLY